MTGLVLVIHAKHSRALPKKSTFRLSHQAAPVSVGDIADVPTTGKADAALAASIFHYGEISICDLKKDFNHAAFLSDFIYKTIKTQLYDIRRFLISINALTDSYRSSYKIP